MSDSKARTTILNLTTLNSSKPIAEKDFFYYEELAFFKRNLDQFAEEAAKHRDSNDRDRVKYMRHNTMMLMGKRGAGKTTFLNTLQDMMSGESKDSGTKPRVHFMDMIDPSMLEHGDIFLALIVSAVLSEVKRHHQRRTASQSYHTADPEFEKEKLNLARRLRVLIHGSMKDVWKGYDDDLFALEITNYAEKGLNLQDYVHCFLGQAIKVLGVDLLVLPIDDADTTFSTGFDVLETVRKYLVSPYLVPIVSGDLDLFRWVLRDQFTKEAGELIKHERYQEQTYDQIDELVGQYLEKLMRSNLRQELHPISAAFKGVSDYRSVVVKTNDGQTEPIAKFFARFLEAAFHLNFTQKDPDDTFTRTSAFLGVPLENDLWEKPSDNRHRLFLEPKFNKYAALIPDNNRLMIAVLRGIDTFLADDSPDTLKTRLQGLFHAWSYYLQDQKVTQEELLNFLAKGNESRLSYKLFTDWRDLSSLHTTEPRYEDRDAAGKNILALVLRLVLTQSHVQNPYRILEHLLVVSMLHLEYAGLDNDAIESVIKTLELGKSDNSTVLMSRYGALLFGEKIKDAKVVYKFGLWADEDLERTPFEISLGLQELPPHGKDDSLSTIFNFYRYLGVMSNLMISFHNHANANHYSQSGVLAEIVKKFHRTKSDIIYPESGGSENRPGQPEKPGDFSTNNENLNQLINECFSWFQKASLKVCFRDSISEVITAIAIRIRSNLEKPFQAFDDTAYATFIPVDLFSKRFRDKPAFLKARPPFDLLVNLQKVNDIYAQNPKTSDYKQSKNVIDGLSDFNFQPNQVKNQYFQDFCNEVQVARLNGHTTVGISIEGHSLSEKMISKKHMVYNIQQHLLEGSELDELKNHMIMNLKSFYNALSVLPISAIKEFSDLTKLKFPEDSTPNDLYAVICNDLIHKSQTLKPAIILKAYQDVAAKLKGHSKSSYEFITYDTEYIEDCKRLGHEVTETFIEEVLESERVRMSYPRFLAYVFVNAVNVEERLARGQSPDTGLRWKLHKAHLKSIQNWVEKNPGSLTEFFMSFPMIARLLKYEEKG